MPESSYIKLSGSYYFDLDRKVVLKKHLDHFKVVQQDRRRVNRPVRFDRRKKAEESPVDLKPLSNDLYWDRNQKVIYRKNGGKLILFSKDRRTKISPVDQERRSES